MVINFCPKDIEWNRSGVCVKKETNGKPEDVMCKFYRSLIENYNLNLSRSLKQSR